MNLWNRENLHDACVFAAYYGGEPQLWVTLGMPKPIAGTVNQGRFKVRQFKTVSRVGAALAALCATGGPASAAIKVTVSYDAAWQLVPSGQSGGPDSMTFVFDGHTVRSSAQSNHNEVREKILGSRVRRTDANGLEYDSEVHIRDSHIFLVNVYADHSIITTIEINGQSCNAKREYRLKRGHKYAVDRSFSTGQEVPIFGKMYSNITCSVSST